VIHEAVLEYCEWITTKPMGQDCFARRVKDIDTVFGLDDILGFEKNYEASISFMNNPGRVICCI